MEANGEQLRTLGRNVRRIRDARRYTQDELGERAGTTRNYIASLETGRIKVPSAWKLHDIARALDVTMETLLGAPGLSAPTSAGVTLPEAQAELARRLRVAGIPPFAPMDEAGFHAFLPESDVPLADLEAAGIVAVSTFLDYAHDLDRAGIAGAFYGAGVAAHVLVAHNS